MQQSDKVWQDFQEEYLDALMSKIVFFSVTFSLFDVMAAAMHTVSIRN